LRLRSRCEIGRTVFCLKKIGERTLPARRWWTPAVQLSLPVERIERLKLMELGQIRVFTADGSEHEYRVMGIAEVEVQGRTTHVQVIELPRGAKPLLGAVPLEEMDWHISPIEKKLLPNPRSPERPLLPLC